MAPYYILFVFFGILSFVEHFNVDKYKIDFWFFVSFFVLLFFYGLRYDVGIDWHAYYLFFDQVESLPFVLQGSTSAPNFYSPEFQPMDIGYRLLNSIFKTLGGGFQSLIFAITLFNISSLYIFLLNQKVKFRFTLITIFLSLAMFREFDVFRQSISFYIFLYSLRYLNSSVNKYILVNLIGALFHLGAIVFVLIIPILRMRHSRVTLVVILTLYLLTLFVPLPIISGLLSLMEALSFFPSIMTKLLAMHEYINYPREFGLTISLPCIILLIIVILNYPIYAKLNGNNIILVNLFVCYLVVAVVSSEINEALTRFGYYFFIGIAAMFSLLPIFLAGKLKLIIAIIPMVFALTKFSLMMTTAATKITYTPYTNYIFNYSDDREERVLMKKDEVSNYYYYKLAE